MRIFCLNKKNPSIDVKAEKENFMYGVKSIYPKNLFPFVETKTKFTRNPEKKRDTIQFIKTPVRENIFKKNIKRQIAFKTYYSAFNVASEIPIQKERKVQVKKISRIISVLEIT